MVESGRFGKMMMAGRVLGMVILVAGLMVSRPAAANNHLIALDEVLGSWQGDDTLQFIELRLLADGQTQLSDLGGARGTTDLVLDDASGGAATRRIFVFTHDLQNGLAGARFLVATQAFATRFGITPDFVLPTGFLAPRDGRVCYRVNPPQDQSESTGVIDCVAYGKFTGDNGSYGPPVRLTPDDRSLQRVARNGQNRGDWAAELAPTPENNAGQATELATLCGDGSLNQGEECDGDALGGKTCADLGFAKGTLACRQCHLDSSACTACGNDAINGSEQCDGSDLGGKTCATLGFTGGTLACTDRCKLSTATCDPTFFVPGGGPRAPECLATWQITNAGGRPGSDGKAPSKQKCKDSDAGCDADTVAGTCTFTVALCFDRDDARLRTAGKSCTRPAIESWTLLGPAAGDATVVGALTSAVAALGNATVNGASVTFAPPLSAAEHCTAPVALTVATRGKLALKTRTTAAGGRPRDADTLKLLCRP